MAEKPEKPKKIKETKKIIQFNPCYKKINNFPGRYRVLMGGAGSGKSVNVAQDFILKLMEKTYQGANLLVLRKCDEYNHDSTFAELMRAASRACGPQLDKVWKIKQSPLAMTCLATGNKILFRGMKDGTQREKLKSISTEEGKITWIWMEEATEFTKEDLELLDDRLRGKLEGQLFYQLTLTFNPVSSSHWLRKRFFDGVDDNVCVSKTTYLDNRFIDGEFIRRMERRREHDPEGYRVYALGEWGDREGLIFTHYEVAEFDRGPERFDSAALGTDFGFNHYHATLLVAMKDGDIFVLEELYQRGLDTLELEALLAQRFCKELIMWCDSAEPDRVRTLRKAGWKARAVKKEPGSVRAQIDFIKGRRLVVHPSCVNTIAELGQWCWKKDEKQGLWLDEPVNAYDDAMAALRYAVEGWRRTPGVEF